MKTPVRRPVADFSDVLYDGLSSKVAIRYNFASFLSEFDKKSLSGNVIFTHQNYISDSLMKTTPFAKVSLLWII